MMTWRWPWITRFALMGFAVWTEIASAVFLYGTGLEGEFGFSLAQWWQDILPRRRRSRRPDVAVHQRRGRGVPRGPGDDRMASLARFAAGANSRAVVSTASRGARQQRQSRARRLDDDA